MNDTDIKVSQETITCGLSDVNPDCAEWVPSGWFVVAGSEGTALSSTGAAGTWMTYPDAPHNLRDMTWRENFKEGACLFAWREEDRHFYASADGITWQVAGNLPTTEQISTIAAVDYNPDLGWYCAIGGTSNYAYFSKDLHTWVETTVTKPLPIPMGSVIWMPSTKKYVLMPTSGTYYYTFSPEEWEGATGDDTGDDTGA